MLPFSREEFLAVFVAYNTGVWPAQVVAYSVGPIVLAAIVRRLRASGRIIGAALAAMWIWTGIAYHGLYFSAINPAALGFAALFVLQGIALVYAGATDRFRPSPQRGWPEWTGWALVAYSVALYPLIGIVGGHRYPELPMFGITPCPVTLFSFGVLLLARAAVPWWLLLVPFVWSVIGGSAAFLLGIPQDWLLLASGVIAVPLILRRHGRVPAADGGRHIAT